MNSIKYWRTTNKNTFTHNYRIPLNINYDTISELNLMSDKLVNLSYKNIKINFNFINKCILIQELMH